MKQIITRNKILNRISNTNTINKSDFEIKAPQIKNRSFYIVAGRKISILCIISCLIIATAVSSGCNNSAKVSPGMNIGSEGIDFAKSLVTQFPFRKAYSEQEKSVSALIETEIKKMGYKPVIQTFGADKTISQNIIIKIEGTGFKSTETTDDSSAEILIRKQIIIGVHYDTAIGIEKKAEFPDYDGIQENASGVGALISVAKELGNRKNGYDVVMVFFGAGGDNFAGASAYLKSMTAQEIENTDAMYCIESIYAGDKLYAHSGINSTQKGVKYEKRRKLYELSDIAIANIIDLRFNESDLDVDVNGDKVNDVYREITTTKSDYSVFDAINIPCVFIESYDYFGATIDVQMESKNPSFGTTKGKIRGTNFDSMAKLSEILEKGRLETRIKNTSFLIVKVIEKGMSRATAISTATSSSPSSVK